jgi:flagellar biosynthetic protein FliR
VTAIGSDTVLLVFLAFCRIGGCLMLMPGFSSSRVPVQVRLFIALAVTLAMTPLLLPTLQAAVPLVAAGSVLGLFVSETAIGVLIGAMGRIFFLALQFMATAAATYIGLGSLPGAPIEDHEPVPAFVTLVTLTATLLFFLTDQHWDVLRALLSSYSVLPVTGPFAAEFNLSKLTDATATAFLLALQISAPFVVYGLIVNFMIGIANKLTPQIPVYFISLPFVLAGGFLLFYFVINESLRVFMLGFIDWLAKG